MLKCAAAVLLILPTLAFAWGGEGHQVVALIAETGLTPEAKAAYHELLGADVHIYDAEIASWADQVRRSKGYTQTAPWHYVDIPIGASGYDAKRDGNKGNNLIDQLDAHAAILADRSKSKDERAEALKWVVHLAGDIEQPLHCAERNDDRGGNKQLCWMPESKAKQASNLHTIWDSKILRTMIGTTNITDFADSLNDKIKPEDAKAWAIGPTSSWAVESWRIAGTKVYTGVVEGTCPVLPQKYVDDAKPVIEGQLERGGVRLAAVLNKALSGPTTRPAQ
jgi:hypothetical protein